MNFVEDMTLTGTLKIVLSGEDGVVKEEHEVKNLVVTAGKSFIASRIKDATSAVMSHMAIGSGTTAAAVGDTTLGTELGRAVLSSTTTSTNSVIFSSAFLAAVGTGAITEAGLFNAASAGTMLCRTVFPVINKGAADVLVITWTVTVN
jgi:hypothetical protein